MNAAEVTAAAKAGTEQALAGLKVSSEQHLLDHDWVKSTRQGIKTVRRGSLGALGVAIMGGIGWAIKIWISAGTTGGTP